jgi:hypothetical protein
LSWKPLKSSGWKKAKSLRALVRKFTAALLLHR